MARIDSTRKKIFTGIGYAGFIAIVGTGVIYGMIPAAQQYAWMGWGFGLLCLVAYALGGFETIRDYFGRRSARHGANAVILTLLVIGILIFAEAISARHSARFDLTSTKRFTLSGQTLKILDTIERPVRITAFFQEGSARAGETMDLLEQYAHACKKVSFDFVDPDRFPGKAKHYKVTAYGTLVIETDSREEKIAHATEQALTNALLRINRKGEKIIFFVTGHGEKSINSHDKHGYGYLKKAMEGQNYAVRDLSLMRVEEVPEGASVVVIAGPNMVFFPEEVNVLRRFIAGGGHLLALIDPETDTGLGEFFTACGIDMGQDVVIDKLSRLFGADYLTPIVSQYASFHPITEDFKTSSFFPLARSVNLARDLPSNNNVEGTELAMTGPSSWAETDLAALKHGEAVFDKDEDAMGPITVAVGSTIRRQAGESGDKGAEAHISDWAPEGHAGEEYVKPARVVVFGDSNFVDNSCLHLSGNRDLIMNTLSWLAEEEDLIAIRPMEMINAPVVLSFAEGRIVFWTSVVLLPAAVLLTGLGVLRFRRTAK